MRGRKLRLSMAVLTAAVVVLLVVLLVVLFVRPQGLFGGPGRVKV